MNNNFIYYILVGLSVIIFLIRMRLKARRKAALTENKKKAQEIKGEPVETYADIYSIPMQADALNRMARRNIYSSRRFSSLNYQIEPPMEYDCYYSQY